jgi:ankyrin repeat protein
VAELLLKNKADVNARNDFGDTPLHAAAMWGHQGVAELLLANGADVNARDKFDNMPLRVALTTRTYMGGADTTAVDRERKAVAELLIRHGGKSLGPSLYAQPDGMERHPEPPHQHQ